MTPSKLLKICIRLFAGALLLIPSFASAAFPASSETLWRAGNVTGTRVYVCETWAKNERPTEYHGVLDASGNCRVLNERDVHISTFTPIAVGTQLTCPANSTLGGSSCSCNASYLEKDGTCVAPPPINNQQNCSDAAAAGASSFGQSRITTKLSAGSSLCLFTEGNSPGVGCRVDLLDVGVIKLPDGTRIVQGFPRRTNTGADTCPISSDPATPKTEKDVNDSPKACPNGQMGTVNGRTVCVKYPAGTTVTTTEPTSSSTTTKKNPDGSPAPVDPNTEVSASDIGQKQCVTGTCTTTSTQTTVNADGTTTTKTTTSSGPDESASDTPFGSVPKLYETKYPDGVSGVWSAQTTAMKNSQVGKLMTSLTPTFQTGGSCPTWMIDLSFAGLGNWGTPNVAPPCWIWPLAKIFTIIGALILARALIFGG